MFSFLHISDLHMLTSETETSHGISPCKRLEHVIDSIDSLEYPPSFAIITGDLSQGGTIEGYELVRRYTERLNEKGIRTMLAMGNNDNRENFRRVFRKRPSRKPVYYTEEYRELRIIILDSLNPGSHGGRFEGEQLEWLSEVLKKDPERPTIIAFHHPINMSSHKTMDGRLFKGSHREEFHRAVAGGNVLAFLYGHLHHNQVTMMDGVLHVQAGSMGVQLNINEEEYWLANISSYNQIIYRNGTLFVMTITLPYDGRVLARNPIQDLHERMPVIGGQPVERQLHSDL
jgi:3',5'-cyclic AMP phosphodiesterase CpdA